MREICKICGQKIGEESWGYCVEEDCYYHLACDEGKTKVEKKV